jgi:cellulose synthase/poly-beta-1,6-N-acetylglucosamine synthase-like glycosyltransferase
LAASVVRSVGVGLLLLLGSLVLPSIALVLLVIGWFGRGIAGFLFLSLSLCFVVGFVCSWRNSVQAKTTLMHDLSRPALSLDRLSQLAVQRHRNLPSFLILIPARSESRVIANTLHHLSQLRYMPGLFSVLVIADAREYSVDGESTTQVVAAQVSARLNEEYGRQIFSVTTVPDDYDGHRLSGAEPAYTSSKGRALNYALDLVVRKKVLPDFIGVLDADGRLHLDVLLEVAKQSLKLDAQVLQGPVFQISNLRQVDLFGLMAGIELSIFHLSVLARELRSSRLFPRFLAGTNYFICPKLLLEVGGWKSTSLVEDAELGLRLFLQRGVRAHWLPSVEIEQTAPSLGVYLKQRERWSLGHLQLLAQVRQAPISVWFKLRIGLQVIRSLLACPWSVVLPSMAWSLAVVGIALPSAPWSMALALFLALISLYSWDQFGRGLRLLNQQSPRPLSSRRVLLSSVALILLLPCLTVIQLLPRITALLSYFRLRRARGSEFAWYKTERTAEAPIGSVL